MLMEFGEWVVDRVWRIFRARGDKRAVAKDQFFEMMTNAERALNGSFTGMPQAFEDKSWQTCRRELTHMLDARAFDKVRLAYVLDQAFSEAERREIEDRLLNLEKRLSTSEEINFRPPHLG